MENFELFNKMKLHCKFYTPGKRFFHNCNIDPNNPRYCSFDTCKIRQDKRKHNKDIEEK